MDRWMVILTEVIWVGGDPLEICWTREMLGLLLSCRMLAPYMFAVVPGIFLVGTRLLSSRAPRPRGSVFTDDVSLLPADVFSFPCEEVEA